LASGEAALTQRMIPFFTGSVKVILPPHRGEHCSLCSKYFHRALSWILEFCVKPSGWDSFSVCPSRRVPPLPPLFTLYIRCYYHTLHSYSLHEHTTAEVRQHAVTTAERRWYQRFPKPCGKFILCRWNVLQRKIMGCSENGWKPCIHRGNDVDGRSDAAHI
jgi:hypothetical protein